MKCTNCDNELNVDAKFCTKCGQKSSSEIKVDSGKKTEKKSVVTSVVSVLVFILAFGTIRYLTQQTFSSSTNGTYSKSELATEAVKQLKATMSLPEKVDSATTLTDVTAESNAIRYHYVLSSSMDTTNLSDTYLKNYLGTNICQNKDTKNLLDQGINMQYSYIVENSTQTYFVSFTKSDCTQ